MAIRYLYDQEQGDCVLYDSVFETPMGLIIHAIGSLSADEVAEKFIENTPNIRYMDNEDIKAELSKFTRILAENENEAAYERSHTEAGAWSGGFAENH